GSLPVQSYHQTGQGWRRALPLQTSEVRLMTEAAPAPRRSRLAIAAQVAAIFGVVVCLLVVLLIWFGRGALSNGVDELAASVNTGMTRAITATEAVARRLDAAATEAARIATQASKAAGSSGSNNDRVRLAARIGAFTDSYEKLRLRYSAIRANITNSVESIRRVARLAPGVAVPRAPTGPLPSPHPNLQSLDNATTSMLPGGGTLSKAGTTAVAGKATKVQATIERTAVAVHGLGRQLEGVQNDAATTANSIRTVLILAAIALTILFVWVLLLNVALWKLGRAMATRSPAAGSPQSATPPAATNPLPGAAAPPPPSPPTATTPAATAPPPTGAPTPTAAPPPADSPEGGAPAAGS